MTLVSTKALLDWHKTNPINAVQSRCLRHTRSFNRVKVPLNLPKIIIRKRLVSLKIHFRCFPLAKNVLIDHKTHQTCPLCISVIPPTFWRCSPETHQPFRFTLSLISCFLSCSWDRNSLENCKRLCICGINKLEIFLNWFGSNELREMKLLR